MDRQHLHEMRAIRRKSLNDHLHQRGQGLNDSHSGRWTTTEEDDKGVDRKLLREMRTIRRKSLNEHLYRRGYGLSDSHSGRWLEENSETKFEKECIPSTFLFNCLLYSSGNLRLNLSFDIDVYGLNDDLYS